MHLYVDLGEHITVMALVGFSASAVQALTTKMGTIMGSLNRKASDAQCFIMALGLFWDIVTGLPWTPNGVGSLEPRGYCIFLPGAHYLTINSPYGADSSLNKLLLLLLLLLLELLVQKIFITVENGVSGWWNFVRSLCEHREDDVVSGIRKVWWNYHYFVYPFAPSVPNLNGTVDFS